MEYDSLTNNIIKSELCSCLWNLKNAKTISCKVPFREMPTFQQLKQQNSKHTHLCLAIKAKTHVENSCALMWSSNVEAATQGLDVTHASTLWVKVITCHYINTSNSLPPRYLSLCLKCLHSLYLRDSWCLLRITHTSVNSVVRYIYTQIWYERKTKCPVFHYCW